MRVRCHPPVDTKGQRSGATDGQRDVRGGERCLIVTLIPYRIDTVRRMSEVRPGQLLSRGKVTACTAVAGRLATLTWHRSLVCH
jgi:hypothetical protein